MCRLGPTSTRVNTYRRTDPVSVTLVLRGPCSVHLYVSSVPDGFNETLIVGSVVGGTVSVDSSR